MHMALSAIDVVIVVSYILATTLIGVWFTRRQRDVRTYFVGDRDVSWWLVLISIVATETSTVTFLSVPGLAYNPNGGNLTFLQLAFGFVIGRILIAWFLLPQYLRGELFSAYQLLQRRFNPAVQRTASALFLVTRTIADGLRLYLASLFLHHFTGWDSGVSVLAIGCATMLYTYLGGMQAVIWTDVIQFVIYLTGALVAGACILQLLPGGGHDFVAEAEAAHKLVLFDWSFDPNRNFTMWTGLIGGAFLTMASHGADQMMVQRYLCSRSLAQARLALILSGVVVLFQFLLFLLLGVGLYVLTAKHLLTIPPEARNDEVVGYFIIRALPVGLVGLVFAAVLAASMSTLSSSLNSSASALVTDFYRPLWPGKSEGHYLIVSRLMTMFWGVTRILVALAAVLIQSPESVVTQVLTVAGFTTGMILGLFILGSLRRAVASEAALAGMVVGFLVVLSVWLPTLVKKEILAWPWYAPIGTTVTVAVAWAVNLVAQFRTSHGSPRNGGPQPGLDEPG
jgi:SSS family transporter